jgi:hypothetical protein
MPAFRQNKLSPLSHKNPRTNRKFREKRHVNKIEKKFDRKPKYLRFDNGKELVNKEMSRWAGEKGVVVETTAPLLTCTTWNGPTDEPIAETPQVPSSRSEGSLDLVTNRELRNRQKSLKDNKTYLCDALDEALSTPEQSGGTSHPKTSQNFASRRCRGLRVYQYHQRGEWTHRKQPRKPPRKHTTQKTR